MALLCTEFIPPRRPHLETKIVPRLDRLRQVAMEAEQAQLKRQRETLAESKRARVCRMPIVDGLWSATSVPTDAAGQSLSQLSFSVSPNFAEKMHFKGLAETHVYFVAHKLQRTMLGVSKVFRNHVFSTPP